MCNLQTGWRLHTQCQINRFVRSLPCQIAIPSGTGDRLAALGLHSGHPWPAFRLHPCPDRPFFADRPWSACLPAAASVGSLAPGRYRSPAWLGRSLRSARVGKTNELQTVNRFGQMFPRCKLECQPRFRRRGYLFSFGNMHYAVGFSRITHL